MVGFFSIKKGQAPNLETLKAIGLAVMYADDVNMTSTELCVETSLDLGSLAGVEILGELSGKLETVEGYDLPFITKGAIVVSVAKNDSDIMQYYDSFVKLKDFVLLDETNKITGSVYIGMSNAERTDFFTPFAGITNVALTPKS